MTVKVSLLCEAPLANVALEGFFSSVHPDVGAERHEIAELFLAVRTGDQVFTSVHSVVAAKGASTDKLLGAVGALIGPLIPLALLRFH
eukprot:1356348-Amorphochlora_amoeboformis.AAC.1